MKKLRIWAAFMDTLDRARFSANSCFLSMDNWVDLRPVQLDDQIGRINPIEDFLFSFFVPHQNYNQRQAENQYTICSREPVQIFGRRGSVKAVKWCTTPKLVS